MKILDKYSLPAFTDKIETYLENQIAQIKRYTISVSLTNGTYTSPTIIEEGSSAEIVLQANTGYQLPSSISVTGATYTYNNLTGKIILSNPTANVTISGICSVIYYSITTSVTYGSYSGDVSMTYNDTGTVTVTANGGYQLPSSISVSGASYTYNSSTGVITLTSPTSNITISVVCLAVYSLSVNIVNGTSNAPNTIIQGDSITINLMPDNGYILPSSISVTNASSNYDSSMSVLNIYNPIGNVSVSIICTLGYRISSYITNGDFAGDTQIESGGTATVYIIPNSGYKLPNYITDVYNAQYSYNDMTGEIYLYNATGDVQIYATCEPDSSYVGNYVKFSSGSSFSLQTSSGSPAWDGTMEYSTDGSSWYIWSGSTIYSASGNGEEQLLLRGTGNTRVSTTNSSYAAQWSWTGTNITAAGNIENLLDYSTVALGNHPAMATYAFNCLFYGSPLVDAKDMILGTETLVSNCYRGMFNSSSSLRTPPQIKALETASSCMIRMFESCLSLNALPAIYATRLTSLGTGVFRYCSNIKVSTSSSSTYKNAYRIPMSGTGSFISGSSLSTSMFAGTGGSFTGNPTINTTYYTSNDIIGIQE